MSNNILQVLKSLRIADEYTTSIHLVGSRLWGTHTESSDFDLLLIAEELPTSMSKSHHKGQYDITLLTKPEFSDRLRQGSFIETVCCLIEGEDGYIWRMGGSMKDLVPDIETLETWVAARKVVDCEKAKKFWSKGKREEAFKILQHMIMTSRVTRELRRMAELVGHLNRVVLRVQDLQTMVKEGRDDNDKEWLSLSWSEVETAHRARIKDSKS
jgi:hypothetical protein